MKKLGKLDRVLFLFLYKISNTYFGSYVCFLLIFFTSTVVIFDVNEKMYLLMFVITFFLLLAEIFFINSALEKEFRVYERYLRLNELKHKKFKDTEDN